MYQFLFLQSCRREIRRYIASSISQRFPDTESDGPRGEILSVTGPSDQRRFGPDLLFIKPMFARGNSIRENVSCSSRSSKGIPVSLPGRRRSSLVRRQHFGAMLEAAFLQVVLKIGKITADK